MLRRSRGFADLLWIRCAHHARDKVLQTVLMTSAMAMEKGERLIPALIDLLAADPAVSRPWAVRPRDSDDLSEGFVEVSYKEFANAIDHAVVWLGGVLGACQGVGEAFAYQGPSDLRIPVLVVAAAKVGRQVGWCLSVGLVGGSRGCEGGGGATVEEHCDDARSTSCIAGRCLSPPTQVRLADPT